MGTKLSPRKRKTLDRQADMQDASPVDRTLDFPIKQRVWKTRVCDNIEDPKTATAFLVRARDAYNAIDQTKKTEGFKSFQEAYPKAELVALEFVGEMS